MKVLKYIKKKNGMYQIFFDDYNTEFLHEEIILKYDILLKKDLSKEEIDSMLLENKKYLAYDLAIKYLSKKMKTIKEMKEYLHSNSLDNNTIKDVIELLKEKNYLDDESYCRSFINDKILLSNDGPNKIKRKLIDLGIEENIVDNSLQSFTDDLQKEKIRKLSNKQITINKTKSSNMLKNKIIDYLYNLGYRKDLILEVLDELEFKNDKSIMEKEYNKIYKKLSKKYSGKELEYKIKQKMYSLGFSNYD